MTMDFKDKIVIVTGAVSGIGKEIAVMFGEHGAKLVICDISEEIKNTKSELLQSGTYCESFQMDVTNYSQIENMVNIVLDKLDRVDILINNAGIIRDNLLLRMKEEDWDKVLSINLKGTFLCTKAVSKPMIRQRSGKIVNISSIIGLIGNAGQTNYSASKAGIIGFTKSCAKELATRNINVNAIAPGYIDTKMTKELNSEVKEKILSQIPLARFGKPKDVAEVALFLASALADYITGQVIVVDGGMT